MTEPVRIYMVTNPGPVFGPGGRVVIRSSAPAGSVVDRVVDGHPVRVHR
ncbi:MULTISPECIES: hypothetical protein [unclassified Streptomyces]